MFGSVTSWHRRSQTPCIIAILCPHGQLHAEDECSALIGTSGCAAQFCEQQYMICFLWCACRFHAQEGWTEDSPQTLRPDGIAFGPLQSNFGIASVQLLSIGFACYADMSVPHAAAVQQS